MAFVSATKHLHYAGRFLSLPKRSEFCPSHFRATKASAYQYTIRHGQLVRYIISGKENALDTPWQTNEQLHEH